jgi:hypothetical protein
MRLALISYRTAIVPGKRGFQASLFFAAMLCLPGCAEKQVHVRPWHVATNIRPRLPATAPSQIEDADAPDIPWDFTPAVASLGLLRQPVRPRVPAPQQQEVTDTRQPPPLSLAPQLSQQEIAAAQAQLNESVAVAQRNLDAAKGRTLNPTQADLASKTVTFLQESRDAVRDGDWTRAKNLAKKAQVLSEELAASL